MQRETLDLIGGSGEKPKSLQEPDGPCWDHIEYTAEELDAFAAAPVGQLAEHYLWLLEVDPFARNRRSAQLRKIIRERGLSTDALNPPALTAAA